MKGKTNSHLPNIVNKLGKVRSASVHRSLLLAYKKLGIDHLVHYIDIMYEKIKKIILIFQIPYGSRTGVNFIKRNTGMS